jgi:signal transduction histidine kinase
MTQRLARMRRVADWLRRQGALALTVIAIGALVALAGLSLTDRRAADASATRQSIAQATEQARAILAQDRRILDRLAASAAIADTPDSATLRLLGQAPGLAPGLRAAMLFDPTGAPLAGDEVDTAVAALGVGAMRAGLAQPGVPLLVTATVRDGETSLVGLAQPWFASDGAVGGVAVIALDRSAFAGLDIVRDDGTPLFGDDSAASNTARTMAIADWPLALRYSPIATPLSAQLRAAWPRLLILAAGIASALGLIVLLIRRRHIADRELARHARLERRLRKQLKEATAAASRTDEISRTKSQFLAQVTHELRTPLNAILGFSETIRHELFGPVANPRYRDYAGLIHDAGSHLLSLINDLLDSARIEAGKVEMSPIRMSAAALARSALDLVELLAEQGKITLATVGTAKCPDLNVDARAMKQVLVNLLSNAIKYTPPGGRIELRFAAGRDGGAKIEVADTGAGMSAEEALHAFEPFGRSGHNRTRRQPGTGLGLSLARSMVRLHGGDLTLSSRPGAGTTATISLPAAAAFGKAKAQTQASPAPEKPDAAAA